MICRVTEPSSTFCIFPKREVAVRARPKAAVAVVVVPCMEAPRRTISVERMAAAFTNPSADIARTI